MTSKTSAPSPFRPLKLVIVQGPQFPRSPNRLGNRHALCLWLGNDDYGPRRLSERRQVYPRVAEGMGVPSNDRSPTSGRPARALVLGAADDGIDRKWAGQNMGFELPKLDMG